MPPLLLLYYVFPYQRSTGQLGIDGSLDWFTGEVFLALSFALVYISLGLLAARVIRARYSPAMQTVRPALEDYP